MLVLSRKPMDSIQIGSNIVVTVLGIQGNKVRLGIYAPREIRVLRSELKSDITAAPARVVPGVGPVM